MNIPDTSKLTRSDAGNCWVYGCASVVVVGIVGMIIAVFSVKMAYNKIVDAVTDEVAAEIPAVEATDAEQTATIEKYDAWVSALDNGTGKDAIELSQQDINILIQHHPEFEEFSTFGFVTIDGSEIQGDVSVPLDTIATATGFDRLNGRFFNGSVKLDISFQDGYLEAYINEATLKGEAVSDEFMAGLRAENIAKELNNDPEIRDALRNIESVEIKDGKVVITPKAEGAVKSVPEPVTTPQPVERVPEAAVEESPLEEENAA
jgi:hypothetical protein